MSPSACGAESVATATEVGVRSGRERNCWVPPGTSWRATGFPGPICLAGFSIRKWKLPSPAPSTFSCVVTVTLSPGTNGLTGRSSRRGRRSRPRSALVLAEREPTTVDLPDPRGRGSAEADLRAGHPVPAPGDREHAHPAPVAAGVMRCRKRVVGRQRRSRGLRPVAPTGRHADPRNQAAQRGRQSGQPELDRRAAGRRSLRSHAPRSRMGSYAKQPDSAEELPETAAVARRDGCLGQASEAPTTVDRRRHRSHAAPR